MPTRRQAVLGFRIVILFLLPFCAAGAGGAWLAVRGALAGDWTAAGYYALFALVFGGVGGGLLAMVLRGRVTLVDAVRLAETHPDEPWLWRADWAAKRVHDSVRGAMCQGILFAALWNLISIPVAVAVVGQELPKGNPLALLVLVFPLAGVGLAIHAIRQTLRYRRFGTSSLALERVPIPVGHRLIATVRTTIEAPPADGFRIVLSCINRRTTGSGEDTNTSERVVWQEQRRIRGTVVRDFQGAGTTIPIDFAIPPDVRGTDESAPGDAIVWRLSLSASLPGLDYASQFDVPVYRTAASAEPAPCGTARVATNDLPDPQAAPSPITVTRGVEGTAIVFPAFRNPGPVLSLAGFTLLWTATIWLQRWVGAPLVFPVLTGLVACLLWWAVLAMAFGSSRVVVRSDGLVVTHRFLGIPRRRTVATADVAGVEMPIQMQAGSTPYYSILVRRRAIPGRRLAGAVTLASGIRDKREAERLVATIAEALGRTTVAGR